MAGYSSTPLPIITKRHKKEVGLCASLRFKFSTDSEEIFVEIKASDFTNVLQAHTYNILHTLAAMVQYEK